MKLKDEYIHVGPNNTNEKALVKNVATSGNNIVITRADLEDSTQSIPIPFQVSITNGTAPAPTAEIWIDLSVKSNSGVTVENIEDISSYGVEWEENQSSPTLTKIGSSSLHSILPIQSAMKGCVVQNGTVQYYLNPSDWSKKLDGSASRLDGQDGVVQVETPAFYGKSSKVTRNGKIYYQVKISENYIDETWQYVPAMLIDAYHPTVIRAKTSGQGYLDTLDQGALVSVVNTTSNLRGGNNSTTNDSGDQFKRNLGKPATAMSRAAFRTSARKAGNELLCYEYWKWILYWLPVIEFRTFDIQNASVLGTGVTNANSTNWSNYNAYCPLTPNGYTNSLGNGSGSKPMSIPNFDTVTLNTSPNRYRGIENPFGDIWTNIEGIVINIPTANGIREVYTTTDPGSFGDDITKMNKAGDEVSGSGYIKEFNIGSNGHIIPISNGGGDRTYKCDYHYADTGTGTRTLLLGGGANRGAYAGLGCWASNSSVGYSDAYIGARSAHVLG